MKAHFDVVCPTLIARKKELDTGDKTGKIGYVQRVSCVVGRKPVSKSAQARNVSVFIVSFSGNRISRWPLSDRTRFIIQI